MMPEIMESLSMKANSENKNRSTTSTEETNISKKGNWMQQANQRLLLRMARFTEEDRLRLQESINQCRQALLSTHQVSLVQSHNSGIFKSFKRLKRRSETTYFSNGNSSINSSNSNNQVNFDMNTAIKSKFWTHSKKPIRQSLIKSTRKDVDKAAVKIFNILTTYANCNFKLESGSDSDSSLNATHQTYLIQSLIEKVLSYTELRDEIYLQLIKQITDNNDLVGGTNNKYWQILSVVCNVVKPNSQQIIDYLDAHFKMSGIDSTTEEGRFAIYCQKCLNRTIEKNSRLFIPSTKEVNAVIRRQCMKLRVYLLDGTFRKVEVFSHTTNGELIKIVKNKVALKPDTSGWSLFEQMGRCEKHSDVKELVSDMLFRWESLKSSRKCYHKVYLLFKKRICEEKWFDKNDQTEVDLLTHQCISDIFEDRLKLTIDQAAEICALRLIQENCDPYVSLRILPQHLRPTVNQNIILKFAENIKNLPDFDIKDCNLKILYLCKKCDPFCAIHFPVSQYSVPIWPTEITVSVNRKGLYFTARLIGSILLFTTFSDIIRISVRPIGFFTMYIKNEQFSELKMYSNVAEDISTLIRDYLIDQSIIKTRKASCSSFENVNNFKCEIDNKPPNNDCGSSIYSIDNLPVPINGAICKSKTEHKDGYIDYDDGEKRSHNMRYLKEYFDSFSLQSDEIFDLRESPQSLPYEIINRNMDRD